MQNCLSADTSSEWIEWLREQEEKALQSYQLRPKKLIADYYGEDKTTKDYQGREILELLQNANDAAAEYGIKGQVVVKLLEDGLIIANKGKPFTKEGIESLLIADLSPKRFNKNNFIGQKGLGFRAILNWSHHPIIISGSLSLTYSDNKIKELFDVIHLKYPEIGKELDIERKNKNDIILPRLSFPTYLTETNTSKYLDNKISQNIYKECRFLKNEGFDTVIGMPFYNDSIFEKAKNEINNLQPEILIFTKNLSELRINILNNERLWKIKTIEGNDVHKIIALSKSENSEIITWNVYRTYDSLPHLTSNSSVDIPLEYEIIIAVPQQITDDPQAYPFFSYFPTEAIFPFPVICHATVELEANRKHPQESVTNEFIFNKIAWFLANVAELQVNQDDKWYKTKIVTRIKDYEQSLIKVGFESKLLNQLNNRNIIPVLSGEYLKPSDSRKLKADSLSWLPCEYFKDIVLPTNNGFINKLLNELDVPNLLGKEMQQRVDSIIFNDIDSRAQLIAGLLNYKLLNDFVPEILIDENYTIISQEKRIYLQPIDSTNKYDLPSWINIAFLNNELRNKLVKYLMIQDQRDLRQKLSIFNVNEYSLANVAGAVISESRRRCDADPNRAADYIKEALIALLLMFPDEEPPILPDTTNMLLPNRQGTYTNARQLYFSEGYEANGQLLNALYLHFAPEKLLAPPDELGLDGTNSNHLRFIKWLGVADFPREEKTSSVEKDYLNYILDSLSYPVRLEDTNYEKKSDFSDTLLQQVKTIDYIDNILKSDPGAIITWLAIDERASRWRYPDSLNGVLSDRPYRAQNYRRYSDSIPSYIRWKIQETQWLPASDNKLEKPSHCIYGEKALEKILPPPAEFEHFLFKLYNIDRLRLRQAWDNCGVLPDFSYLRPSQIISILTELPQIDPEGKSARTLYRNLLEQVDLDRYNWQESLNRFKNKGLMWGKGPEGVKYYSIKDLRHADTDDIPEMLSSKINLVDIPKRVGALKVQKLFGVDSIDNRKFTVELKDMHESYNNKDIQVLFNRAKPFLYSLRQAKTKPWADISQFKRLKIVLCSKIDVSLHYEELYIDNTLTEPYQYVIKDDTAYILEDPNESNIFQSDIFADTIGAIIANTFRIDNGSDFARILRCDEKDRQLLLKRILGDSTLPDIEVLKKEFDDAGKFPGFEYKPNAYIEKIGGDQVDKHNIDKEDQREESTNNTSKRIIENATLNIDKIDHHPSASTKRQLVIHAKITVTDIKLNTTRRLIDGNLCEDHVMLFESYEGRWPLKVSGIQGYEGARCDIISFNSKLQRDEFISMNAINSFDLNLVDRFIEVKGRSNEKGSVQLKGNELNAAQVYAEKYYLYRLYEEQDNDYILLVLNNPLYNPEAVEKIYEVDLSRANKTEKYKLSFSHDVNNDVCDS